MQSTKFNHVQKSCPTEPENRWASKNCAGQSILTPRNGDFTICHLHAELSVNLWGKANCCKYHSCVPTVSLPSFFPLNLDLNIESESLGWKRPFKIKSNCKPDTANATLNHVWQFCPAPPDINCWDAVTLRAKEFLNKDLDIAAWSNPQGQRKGLRQSA